MAGPTATELQGLMKQTFAGDDLTQAVSVMSIVSTMAKSYTRGAGFDGEGNPADDVKAVILTATARMLKLPPPGVRSEAMGPFAAEYTGSDFSWTVAEKYTLDRYRVRAQ